MATPKEKLEEAIYKGDVSRARRLLPKLTDAERYDGLQRAIGSRSENSGQIAAVLINSGLDFSENDAFLNFAVSQNKLDVAELLINKGSARSFNALDTFAQIGNTAVVQTILSKYPGSDTIRAPMNHALIAAASHGQTDTAKLLVAAGADLNFKNYNGLTAASSAHKFGKTETYDYLRSAGSPEADLQAIEKSKPPTITLNDEEQKIYKRITASTQDPSSQIAMALNTGYPRVLLQIAQNGGILSKQSRGRGRLLGLITPWPIHCINIMPSILSRARQALSCLTEPSIPKIMC